VSKNFAPCSHSLDGTIISGSGQTPLFRLAAVPSDQADVCGLKISDIKAMALIRMRFFDANF
jgi:hypothetical protein